MSDRTKELIIKTLIVIDTVLIFILFPGGILWLPLMPDEEVAFIVFYVIFFTTMGVGALFMILLPIFGGIKSKPVKAEKVALPVSSYDELLSFLSSHLSQKGYQLIKTTLFFADGEVTLYIKQSKLWKLGCFTIIFVPELTYELIEKANDNITDILNEYYNSKTITDTINMISVFCVDRITPAFQKLVNSNVRQGLKNGRLPVGISFGGKNIYISKQKDGFAIAKYKQLRREFIDIMNLQNTKK